MFPTRWLQAVPCPQHMDIWHMLSHTHRRPQIDVCIKNRHLKRSHSVFTFDIVMLHVIIYFSHTHKCATYGVISKYKQTQQVSSSQNTHICTASKLASSQTVCCVFVCVCVFVLHINKCVCDELIHQLQLAGLYLLHNL